MSDNILYDEVKRRVINKLYPVDNYPLKVREYLAEKNNLVILGICDYIAPRCKGQKIQSVFKNLLQKACAELEIDTNSLYVFDEEELNRWAYNKALEKSGRRKR